MPSSQAPKTALTQSLDTLQEVVAARIDQSLVDYPLEAALALPPN